MHLLAPVLLASVVASSTVGLAPAIGDDATPARLAAVWVIEELVLLQELGALTEDEHAVAIHGWAEEIGAPREDVVGWLRDVDALNASDLDDLRGDGWSPPGEASRSALGPLAPADLDAIAAGGAGVVDAVTYVDAALELLLTAGAQPPPGDPADGWLVVDLLEALPASGPAGLEHLAEAGLVMPWSTGSDPPVGGSVEGSDSSAGGAAEDVGPSDGAGTDAARVDTDGSVASARAGDPSRAVLAVVLGLSVLAVVAASLLVRRRRSGATTDPSGAPPDPLGAPPDPTATTTAASAPTPPPPAPPAPPPGRGAATVTGPARSPADLVLEASRWMTEALDTALVRAIAVSTAVDLLGGDDGGFVSGRRAAARWVPATPAWAPVSPLGDATVARALDTAQSGAHVVTGPDDQVHAVASAPVLVDGQLIGALVVARHGREPFDRDELARLELLTPVVGTALGAAESHLGAVAAAEIDELTQLHNRRRLDADLGRLLERERVAFAMVDVDHFKLFNDTNGHATGDVALHAVAQSIAAAVRPTDEAYRYGGEEFAVLLHGCDGTTATAVMERVAAAVRALVVPGMGHQPAGHLSVSIGVAASDGRSVDQLVGRADAALYRAKEQGRDRVVLAATDTPARR